MWFNVISDCRLYREDLAVSGQQQVNRVYEYPDYTERIWRYQDNSAGYRDVYLNDYTERIWRYQDNCARRGIVVTIDYTERIWRYQDNVARNRSVRS